MERYSSLLKPALLVAGAIAMTITLAFAVGVKHIFGLGLCDQYAAHYSERNFDRVTLGMAADEVRQLVGEPVDVANSEEPERWLYADGFVETPQDFLNVEEPRIEIRFGDDKVTNAYGATFEKVQSLLAKSKSEVIAALGNPIYRLPATVESWHYVRQIPSKERAVWCSDDYRIRRIDFDAKGLVGNKLKFLWID